MADPVRLYSPNPLAPTSAGGPDTPQPNYLAQILASRPPSIFDQTWRSFTPEMRSSYLSLANVLAELSPGAAVRDTVNASGDLGKNALSGNFWGSMGAGTNLLTAMAGIVPGARSVIKSSELASGGARMAAPKAAELIEGIDPRHLTFRETMQNKLPQVSSDFPPGAGYTPLVVVNDGGKMTILDGHNRASVALDRGDKVNAVSVPAPLYQGLKARGVDDMDIAHAAHGWAGQEDAAQAIRQQFPGASFYKSEEKLAPFFEAFEEGKTF